MPTSTNAQHVSPRADQDHVVFKATSSTFHILRPTIGAPLLVKVATAYTKEDAYQIREFLNAS